MLAFVTSFAAYQEPGSGVLLLGYGVHVLLSTQVYLIVQGDNSQSTPSITFSFLKFAQMFALYQRNLGPKTFEPKDGHLLFNIRPLSEQDNEKIEIAEILLREKEVSIVLQGKTLPSSLRVL